MTPLEREERRKQRNKELKKRYTEYRKQGYDSTVAKVLSQRSGKIKPTVKEIASIQERTKRNYENRKTILQKRVLVYEQLGYDNKTSRALSRRRLDVSKLEISERTGKLKRNKTTKQYIEKDLREWKHNEAIENYRKKIKTFDYSDTVYEPHGMLTHDKRYKGDTGRIITIIKNEHKLSRNQAYFFFYFMNLKGLTYEQTKLQLLSNKEFEEYDARKKARMTLQHKGSNNFTKTKKGKMQDIYSKRK